MGAEFAFLQRAIEKNGLIDRTHLISVSFDPRDDTSDLKRYIRRFNAKGDHWTGAIVADSRARAELLKKLGVIVIPEENLGFIHNGRYLSYTQRKSVCDTGF